MTIIMIMPILDQNSFVFHKHICSILYFVSLQRGQNQISQVYFVVVLVVVLFILLLGAFIFVTTPIRPQLNNNLTQPEPNLTQVGFDTKMTLRTNHPHHPTAQPPTTKFNKINDNNMNNTSTITTTTNFWQFFTYQ